MNLPNTTPVAIPVPLDTPLFSMRVTLDAIEYLLNFTWADREGRWYLDIGDVNGTWNVSGLKIVCNWPLLRRQVSPALPQGFLMAVDNSNMGGEPPNLQDLGRRVIMCYYPVSQ